MTRSGTDFWNLVGRRRGHFLLESGHHGDLWLDLEALFVEPRALRPFASLIGSALLQGRDHHARDGGIEVVCGPLVEGAFLALEVAQEILLPFTYSIPVRSNAAGWLFTMEYEIPRGLHAQLEGKRVAIVNDFINAGSAVRGTIRSLEAIGAEVTVIACLATLGSDAEKIASRAGARLETLDRVGNTVWDPHDCPMCLEGSAVEDPGGFG
jgi:orotate phosphoribosyltransferase